MQMNQHIQNNIIKMKKRLNMFLMLGILAFGGFIAYSGMQPTTVIANPPPIIRFTDVAENKSVLNLNLNNETLTLEGTANVEVNIQKKDSIRTVTKWKTRVVEKLVVLDNRTAPFLIKPLVLDNKIPIPEHDDIYNISKN